jgi:hypothetical protein
VQEKRETEFTAWLPLSWGILQDNQPTQKTINRQITEMGIFILVGLILIALVVGLTFLFYWIPKKMGYPKVGKGLAAIVGLFFITLTILTVFEDQLFSKNDAEELLAEQNIKLTDKFELVENKSMSALGDYYHTFTLIISEQDKTRIINEIKSSRNFNLDKQTETYFDNREDYYNGPKRIKNYETENQFVRELFEPQGKRYAPIWRKIEIDKKGNKLIFEDIDE